MRIDKSKRAVAWGISDIMELDLTENVKFSASHLKLFDNIAGKIKLSYIEMINHLGKENSNNIDWWISEIANRNTFSSRLFWDCCLLIFVKEILKNNSSITEIKLSSFLVKKVLCGYLRDNYPNIKVTLIVNRRKQLKDILFPIINYFYLIFIYATRAIMGKLIIKQISPLLLRDLTLVDTFVFDDSCNKGVFQDRYFGGFDKYLSKTEAQSFFYNPTLVISLRKTLSVFRAMKNSRQRFLLKECFLTPADYIFAFLYPWRAIKLMPPRTYWEGFDLTPLLRGEWYYHLTSLRSIEGLLKYRFAARLKGAGLSIRLIIDWFENQSIDKGANAGFHKAYPNVPIVGYMTSFSKYYMCMAHPTSEEYRAGVLPQVLAVSGKGFTSSIKAFCPEIKVVTAPAFRHAWVWQEESPQQSDPQYTTVLVALSLLYEECVNSLQACIDALKHDLPHRVRFWLKPHPCSIPLERIVKKAGVTLPPEFRIVNGDFSEWVEKSDIILGNESSTLLEALARGKPAIVIGHRSRVTMHSIPDAVPLGLWQLCFTSKEVAAAIKFFINRDDKKLQKHRNIANTVREEYFVPVSKESTRNFLLFDEASSKH
jgi:hypothetical protein